MQVLLSSSSSVMVAAVWADTSRLKTLGLQREKRPLPWWWLWWCCWSSASEQEASETERDSRGVLLLPPGWVVGASDKVKSLTRTLLVLVCAVWLRKAGRALCIYVQGARASSSSSSSSFLVISLALVQPFSSLATHVSRPACHLRRKGRRTCW